MLSIPHKEKNITVAFIQPAYAKYRRSLFERFSAHYSTTFFFMEESQPHIWDNHSQEFRSAFQLPRKKSVSEAVHPTKLQWLFSRFNLLRKYSNLLLHLMTNNYQVIVSSIPLSPQTLISLLASKVRRRKCVLWVEDWSIRVPISLKAKLRFYPMFALKMCILRSVDAIVVEGTAQKRHLQKLNIPDEKVFFSNHCSLDYSRIDSQNLKQRLNIKSGLVVLYLGQIVKRKGLDVLIEAFSAIEREIDDVFLVICGDGDFRPFCEHVAKQLKIRHVRFLGTIPEKEIASYYRTADVFVLPSCIRPDQKIKVEGWGLVVNEALSMGLPVITTNVVGAAVDLVRNGFNGYVVKNGNVDDLCLALRRILENENLRKTMGENSRRIFEEFNDFDKMFDGFRRAIEYANEHGEISTTYQ